MLKILSITGADGATYQALEFSGTTISAMSMAARCTLCNMAIEAGAKNGIIPPDDTTEAYLRQVGVKMVSSLLRSDPDASFAQIIEIDAESTEPMVASPFSPANAAPVDHVVGVALDQVIIGACTNGRLEDIETASRIIAGHRIPKKLRCYIVPASNRVYAEASRRGYLADLAEAGCIIVNPGCGGCGIQMPMTAEQVCLGTHNRNFCGRMGSPKSLVYLASPETAAASAIRGCITDPRLL